MAVATTRIFKSGNSLAVRIPKDMTPEHVPEEAQIEWHNGVWTIRPIHRRSPARLMDRFSAFSPDFMAAGRELHEQAPRDWPASPGKMPAPRKRGASPKGVPGATCSTPTSAST